MSDSSATAPADLFLAMLRTIRLQLGTLLEWRAEVSREFQTVSTRIDRVNDDLREARGDIHSLHDKILNFQNGILFELAARDEGVTSA